MNDGTRSPQGGRDAALFASQNESVVVEDGERVYPCRCGQTHRGSHAAYDYAHHNCFHEAPLWPVEEDDGHFLCSACGMSFLVEGRWNAS